ncbi:MAG: aminotransferase class I/II-fold pyridoxal phosphate-dependent enzyme [Ardenticatenaceae bacterium]|nr:aminotransferase class I/II-fold pyridoxal phosphate-dependent enzyme [Ardenticatenaceae bacterium]
MKGKPVITPVHLTATYDFDSSDDLIDVVQNHSGYIYSRWDNPSVVAVEAALAKLEGYEHALGFSSGMAAITTAVLANIATGSRIVATRQIYGGTFEFFNDVLPKLHVEAVFVNCWDTDKLRQEISQGCDIFYLESPTNPMLRVVDIAPLVQAGHAQGAVVMLDSTFASPVNQHPANWDVDVVIHSGTKYIGGHHDITAGFVCCNQAQYERIWDYRKILGGVMDPMTAFLAQRGLQTLDLRLGRQNENAQKVAEFLAVHPKVKSVNYPGLTDHPDYAIARRQMAGFGGMLSFEVDADFEQTKLFMDSLKKIKLATSLGGVTSLANQPITNTHVGLSPENRAKAGVSESLVRLSVGIEDVRLLIEDLEQALTAVA